jgi:hypothetical protein
MSRSCSRWTGPWTWRPQPPSQDTAANGSQALLTGVVGRISGQDGRRASPSARGLTSGLLLGHQHGFATRSRTTRRARRVATRFSGAGSRASSGGGRTGGLRRRQDSRNRGRGRWKAVPFEPHGGRRGEPRTPERPRSPGGSQNRWALSPGCHDPDGRRRGAAWEHRGGGGRRGHPAIPGMSRSATRLIKPLP